MSRFISLSSTSRIFHIAFTPLGVRPGCGRWYPSTGDAPVDHLADHLRQPGAVIRPFLEDAFHSCPEPVSFLVAEILRCHDEDRDFAPLVALPHGFEHLKSIHAWHHQVQQDDRLAGSSSTTRISASSILQYRSRERANASVSMGLFRKSVAPSA